MFHTPSKNVVRAIDNNYDYALLQFYVHLLTVDVQPYMTCMDIIILLKRSHMQVKWHNFHSTQGYQDCCLLNQIKMASLPLPPFLKNISVSVSMTAISAKSS